MTSADSTPPPPGDADVPPDDPVEWNARMTDDEIRSMGYTHRDDTGRWVKAPLEREPFNAWSNVSGVTERPNGRARINPELVREVRRVLRAQGDDFHDERPELTREVRRILRGDVGDEPPPSDELFRTYSTAELIAMGGTIEWLVKGLLVHPTHGMLAGEFKTLKTYIELFINIAIAARVPVFGRFEVIEAATVLQYVGEGGRIPHKGRLERVAESMGVNLKDIPLFTSYDVAPFASDRFRKSLERDLADHQPRRTSIDPLYAYHGDTADARNLHQEGGLLAQLAVTCADAGSSLDIVNHYNQTGTGRGLNRITMAGAAEWCDSWLLVTHREPPDVPAGRFRLLLEIGSRQWGGSEWDLDLNLGHLDDDTLTYDAPITWTITPHRPAKAEHDTDDAVIQTVVDEPWQHTKSSLVKAVGGNAPAARASVDRLERVHRIRHARVGRIENGRVVHRDLYGMFSEPTPEDPQ